MRGIFGSMRAATVLPLVLALAACGDDDGAEPDVPTPGVLTVDLETPNPAEGAVLFRITGPAIEAISAPAEGLVLESHTVGGTTTVAVFGSLESGPIAEVTVPDTRASYSVQLQQVAAGDNTLHTTMTAHVLTIEP